MKRILISLLLSLIMLTLTGCSMFGEEKIVEVEIKTVILDDSTREDSYLIGSFALSDLTLIVAYDNETFINVTVTEDMVSASDLDKLNSVGTHIIDVYYEGFNTSITIFIKDDFTVKLMSIYETGTEAGAITNMTYKEWVDSVQGPQGEMGKEVLFQVKDDFVSWKLDGETTWHQLFDLKGLEGDDKLSSYDLYKLNFPEYLGTEAMWENDLINGTLESIQSWEVSFIYNDDVTADQVIVVGNLRYGPVQTDPRRTGFAFAGWLEGLEEWISFGYIVTDNMTLNASWLIDNVIPEFYGAVPTTIDVNELFDPLDGVIALDDQSGDVTSNIVITSNNVDTTVEGNYIVVYEVKDFAGNSATITRNIEVYDVQQVTELVIVHGAVYQVDPFHEDYSGTDQIAKQELQRQVEAQYNVKIIYENYSRNAAWGTARVDEIAYRNFLGEPLGDIYSVNSDWIPRLIQRNSITNVSRYMSTIGINIPTQYQEFGEYQGGIFGFDSTIPTTEKGLFYNIDLIDSLDVSNPTDLFLEGQWNWSTFEEWATKVQAELDQIDAYALGGMFSYYAEAMTPLNGGRLINKEMERVTFNQNPALEVYDFLTSLSDKGLFESSPNYDGGSYDWMTGKVAMYPGELWYVNSSARWGDVEFELGFVPYPVSDNFTGDYTNPINSVEVYSIASGMSAEREELVFTVWNALQLWKTDEEFGNETTTSLHNIFSEQKSIDSYLAIYDKVYFDIINVMGVTPYGENGWMRNINKGVLNGTSRVIVETISPVYQEALESYLGIQE
jgi:maltose-binding protein MalE